jgi:hypothetical protein
MTVSAAEAGPLIDLAVDTSAVLAVLLREPSCDEILERLCKAVPRQPPWPFRDNQVGR